MLDNDPIVEKYIADKQAERLTYAQLRQRMKADNLKEYQINEVIDLIYQRQEKKRIKGYRKLNRAYALGFGIVLISASIYFYRLGNGINLINAAKGIGWNEYRYLIGVIVLMAIGISELLRGWTEREE